MKRKIDPTEESYKNELLKEFFCAVVPEDVITQDKAGQLYLGGKVASPREVEVLQKEVDFLERSQIWKLLTNSLIDQAHMTMFNNSQSFEDMRSGKMMLYNIGVQKAILQKIKKAVPRKKESTYLQDFAKGIE